MVVTVDEDQRPGPGCQAVRYIHGHHIVFWSDGGATDLPNLLSLCPRHHHLIHSETGRSSVTRMEPSSFEVPMATSTPADYPPPNPRPSAASSHSVERLLI